MSIRATGSLSETPSIRRAARLLAFALASCAAITGVVSAQRGPREDFAAYLPPGDGRELVLKQCTSCHDLKGMVQLRKSKDGWEQIVMDMGARGAPIMLDEVDPVVNYLATVFGPTAPPFTDANTETRDGLTRLPGVTPEAADRLIAARAKEPLASHEQVRAALGLDAKAFEKIKPYIYVKPPQAGSR
jgi:hypothetical protein